MTRARLYRDDAGEWRWSLIARNGRVVADSAEGYHNRADAAHGLEVALQADDELEEGSGDGALGNSLGNSL